MARAGECWPAFRHPNVPDVRIDPAYARNLPRNPLVLERFRMALSVQGRQRQAALAGRMGPVRKAQQERPLAPELKQQELRDMREAPLGKPLERSGPQQG